MYKQLLNCIICLFLTQNIFAQDNTIVDLSIVSVGFYCLYDGLQNVKTTCVSNSTTYIQPNMPSGISNIQGLIVKTSSNKSFSDYKNVNEVYLGSSLFVIGVLLFINQLYINKHKKKTTNITVSFDSQKLSINFINRF